MSLKFFLFLTLLPFFAQAEILEGVAKNEKGETIYVEKHSIQRDESDLNKFIRVEYFKSDGSLFATMTSDFSNHKTVPETTFEDTRFKSKSIMRLKENVVEFEEFKNDKVVSKNTVPMKGLMVASQGFDNFIRMNVSKLNTAALEFSFGVLDSRDFYSLSGYKKSSTSSEIEYGIKSNNWLFRLFTSELRVKYTLKDMKLISFIGRSNILDDSGKAQDVTINYQWKDKL